ncbi:MAG: ABC transporter permease [Rhodospirillales bacterium]
MIKYAVPIIAATAGAPILAVAVLAFGDTGGVWAHLVRTVLADYVTVTLALTALTGFGVFIIGTGAAWLVTMHRFPGDKILGWALVLPIAAPAYIIAYVYTDVLEYAGPVQSALRAAFGWGSPHDYWFPDIRSLGGAACVMTLVLYPYVYLMARAAFAEQSVSALEVARTLGLGPKRAFLRVALPMARPAIVLGTAVACMEVLNDFGTADFFAVRTLTVGLFDVWLNMNSLSGAARIAVIMLVFAGGLLWLERWARRGRRFHNTTTKQQPITRTRLTGRAAVGATLFCALPVLFGFALPAGVLAANALKFHAAAADAGVWRHALHSLELATAAACAAAALGLLLAYGARVSAGRAGAALARFASLGYAVPGAVLAVGVIIPLATVDSVINGFTGAVFNAAPSLILSGTAFAVVYGYVVRFLALAYGAADAGLTKVTPNMEGAARTLGLGPGAAFRRVHMPLMRASIMAAAALVFVDSMKELPMTMLLRPFNFDTLATFVHQYASDELFEEASLGALLIVTAGVIPVILLIRAMDSIRTASHTGPQTGAAAS